MAEGPIISVSGLRGIVGDTLTPEVAARYACGLAAELPAGPIVLTRDGRSTGRMLADAVRSALCAVGRHVIDADIAATPTTGVLIRQLGAAGGVQISASHNPSQYNGLKLFGGDGRVIPAEIGERVLHRYESGVIAWADHRTIGRGEAGEDVHGEHCRLVLQTVDASRIRDRSFHVLLDSNHGAGGLMGQSLLKQLGCEVTAVGAEPNGLFSHTPEPTAENLAEICSCVKRENVVVGFCQDPDADRLALIDEQGRYIGEEYTLAICLNQVLRDQKGPVVTNCSTSRMSEDLADKHGVAFYRSKVGEANVADLMIQHGAVFGGEGNGGPIDPRVGYVRDSFVGMALVLQAMAERDMTLSQLADELPRYEIYKTKMALESSQVATSLDLLEQSLPDAKADRMDGLRLDWPGKWLFVRASNTEPIVRLIAEAKSIEDAKELCENAARVLSRA